MVSTVTLGIIRPIEKHIKLKSFHCLIKFSLLSLHSKDTVTDEWQTTLNLNSLQISGRLLKSCCLHLAFDIKCFAVKVLLRGILLYIFCCTEPLTTIVF